MKSLSQTDLNSLCAIGANADTARLHIAQVHRSVERLNAAIVAAHAEGVDTRLLFDRRDQIDQMTPRCTTPRLDRAFRDLINNRQ